MKRLAVFGFGVASYLLFFGVFLYMVGFLGNLVVPKSIDSTASVSLLEALLVNSGLIVLFGLQHSAMARPAFKRWLTRFIPQPAERPFYVLLSSLALILLFWQWRPMGGIIWNVENLPGQIALYTLYACGWITVFVATHLINHFDLFGLRQVWLYLRGKEYTPLKLATPRPYRHVRHPLYVGWIMAVWATPQMTAAHLLLAAGMTAYILIAIRFEERDLVAEHGEGYETYRRNVPMLIPRLTPANCES